MDQSSFLRICKSCGEDFAKSVKECPHCGKKVQSSMLFMLVIGIGCLAIVATLAIPVKKDQSGDMKKIATAAADHINAADLAAALSNNNSQYDSRVQNKAQEITGKIVQWDLEVFVCTKSADFYQVVTRPTAGVPGALLMVYPLNDQQQDYLDNIQPGNTITVKGKISGIQQGRIKINPALII